MRHEGSAGCFAFEHAHRHAYNEFFEARQVNSAALGRRLSGSRAQSLGGGRISDPQAWVG